jgi:hypothetical protein
MLGFLWRWYVFLVIVPFLRGKHMPKPTFPADHKPGMRVPKGGSSCASCKYLKPGLRCGSEYFVKWNGSDKIPTTSADEYCSDYWEPGERKKQSLGAQLRDQRAIKS